MKFNKEYYQNNNQDKDRIGLFFYKNLIKYYFSPNAILDYGCGTGHLLKRIQKVKTIKMAYGFEINKYAIEKAKKNSKSKIINNLNLIQDKSIDLIISLHVIEHLNDFQLRDTFLSFKRILKNDGFLIFATPAKNGLAHLIKKKKWIGLSDKTHINLKTYEEWNDFFKSSNLKVYKSSSDGLWDFPYNIKNSKILIIKIFIKMILQIFTGKLYLEPHNGETFIFILKSNKV